MTTNEIRSKYLKFFQAPPRNHSLIPSAPLVPENDPTTLFNSAGMQPLVPYILGEPHPLGKRLVNSQKSFRSQDIEEVGDNRHETFFEMLGNWSLGDYFKKEQLPWIYEFLTKELGLDSKRIYVSVFSGNQTVPKDEESIGIWKSVGIPEDHIFTYDAKKNWWSRSGVPEKMASGEPGGPSSEIFYDFGEELHIHETSQWKHEKCHPNCDCGRFLEIGNSVFMQYKKTADGGLVELPKRNVDFGGGLERLNAAVNGTPDIFKTDSFSEIISIIEDCTNKKYGTSPTNTRYMRIIADHIRGSVMMIADGVMPANKQQGYILRRLIRRSVVMMHKLETPSSKIELSKKLCDAVFHMYTGVYFDVKNTEMANKQLQISSILGEEIHKFEQVIHKGFSVIQKQEKITGKVAFDLLQSYGFPWELTLEEAQERGQEVDRDEFEEEFKKHQALSRSASAGMFKGGLADHSVETTKLHTATHLLHQALRTVLGTHVSQKGSNITVQRLRFDFSHAEKMTEEQLKSVEKIVNDVITQNLPVTMIEMDKQEALHAGALGFFLEKYGERVKVYTVGPLSDSGLPFFSREICGGPHVSFTGELAHFTIEKEESLGAGIRRIYAHVGNIHESAKHIGKISSSE